jgi:hypothetical protein
VMAQRGAGFQRILQKYFPGTSVRDRFAGGLSKGERWDQNAEAAEENLCLPLRNPLRPLRLNTPFDDHPSRIWKADLFKAPVHKYSAPAGVNPNPKYLTISSEHFRVAYPAGVDRRDANQVLGTLDATRADFLRRANAASVSVGDLPLLEIRLNDSTGDFTSRTGQPWWAAAATKGNRIELQPVGILKTRGVLVTTLRHELAHVVIDRVSGNRAPRWLEEGFAIYLAGEGPMLAHYATKATISTNELETKLERPGSQQNMRALYALAYQRVVELIRLENESGIWRRVAGY